MNEEKCPGCGGELTTSLAPYYAMPASTLFSMMRCEWCREKMAEMVSRLLAVEPAATPPRAEPAQLEVPPLDVMDNFRTVALVKCLCIEAGVCLTGNEYGNQVEIHTATVDLDQGLLVTDRHGHTFRLRVGAEPVPLFTGGVDGGRWWYNQFDVDEYAPPGEVLDLFDAGIIADCSWGNDCCPSFSYEPTGVLLWVDHHDVTRRELGECGAKRFTIVDLETGEKILAASECWADVAQFLTTCPA